MIELGTIDVLAVAAYLAVVLALGFWAGRGGLGLGLALYLLVEATGARVAAGLPAVHFTYMAMAVFLAAALLAAAVSLAGASPAPAAVAASTFRRRDLRPGGAAAGFRDHRVQAAALAVLMLGFIAALW